MPAVSSAAGFLSLLQEPSNELKRIALSKLNSVVCDFWPEIFDSLELIEKLYEDNSFDAEARNLAALVASKVYFHLGELRDSMTFALGAGTLFDLNERSHYVETIISECIDAYVTLRTTKQAEGAAKNVAGSSVSEKQLEEVVERMFKRCFDDKEYRQALGIALESRRIDKLQQSIEESGEVGTMLAHCLRHCVDTVSSLEWRNQVLRVLVQLYEKLENPDYLKVCQCLVTLDDSESVSKLLNQLLASRDSVNDHKVLLAYQLAFDLVDNATQKFIAAVRDRIEGEESRAGAAESGAEAAQQAPAATGDAGSENAAAAPLLTPVGTVKEILTGKKSISLYLEFLFRNSHADLMILKNMKNAVEARNSVLHGAIICANAIMHAGTTRDAFLRANLEWLARATNWAKFSATAALGVIHKGHLTKARDILKPYLPGAPGNVSPYTEGGSLYALGLIHANFGESALDFLLAALQNAAGNETVQHGACLGLGLAAMGTAQRTVYESLREVMYTDSAVSGEAAAIAMGLTMVGTSDDVAVQEMLAYAHETDHEKIIRGIALGLSLMFYGKEEAADTMIDQLSGSKDPILRAGGMHTVALAYAGTGDNRAISRLLNIAVSDVSDDVRRVAVTALGFVLFRENSRNQCPEVVSLLCESYNPHVRYGSAAALGVACAGTGLSAALDLLGPLREDSVDYVRQGAFIATAMVLMQHSARQDPRVEEFRKSLAAKISDKHETTMCKLGAILATGILDAGGRNVSISLESRSGQRNMSAIVGLSLFFQYWYWYPMSFFLSLSFRPTAVIGLNGDLKMPAFKFTSNAPPSLYAYPPDVKPPTKKKGERVKAAVLSFKKLVKPVDAAKEKEKEKGKAKAQEKLDNLTSKAGTDAAPMAVDSESKVSKDAGDAASAAAAATNDADAAVPVAAAAKEKEASSEVLQNPARVTLKQHAVVSFDVDERYSPVVSSPFGLVMLHDRTPEKPVELIAEAPDPSADVSKVAEEEEDEENEAAPFQSFRFDPQLEEE